MLALRQACRRRCVPALSRGNASLQSAVDAPVSPPPSLLANRNSASSPLSQETEPSTSNVSACRQDTPSSDSNAKPSLTSNGRKKGGIRRRPNISLENPRKWNPPVKKGLLPAYDEALELIERDSKALKKDAATLRMRLAELEGKEGATEEVKEIQDKLAVLDIQAYINLPSVRWKAANGMADMTKAVYRHLIEQKWRTRGDLDLLMERVHQMGVVPDLIPDFHPTIALRMTFPEPPPQSVYLRTRIKRRYTSVEPGSFLLPVQTWKPPRLYTSVYHSEARLYTLVMVDADVPDPENASFTTYLHWLVPNISLSATSSSPITASPPLTAYVPPHPQKGSPYHRYCLFLLPHPDPAKPLNVPVMDEAARRGFDLRQFCEKYGINPTAGGAAHMWREIWDETVSDIYKNTLRLPEPVYAVPPKRDRYAELRHVNKYAT